MAGMSVLRASRIAPNALSPICADTLRKRSLPALHRKKRAANWSRVNWDRRHRCRRHLFCPLLQRIDAYRIGSDHAARQRVDVAQPQFIAGAREEEEHCAAPAVIPP